MEPRVQVVRAQAFFSRRLEYSKDITYLMDAAQQGEVAQALVQNLTSAAAYGT